MMLLQNVKIKEQIKEQKILMTIYRAQI